MTGQRVAYLEHPRFEMARFLRERGYIICDDIGKKVREPDSRRIGVLDAQKKRMSMFRPYIGNIWLDNKSLGADVATRWVVEAYGRENAHKLGELVDEVARPYNVGVEVRLEREKSDLSFAEISFRGLVLVSTVSIGVFTGFFGVPDFLAKYF